MTAIYSHLAPDYMANEISRLSFRPSSLPSNLRRHHAAKPPLCHRDSVTASTARADVAARPVHGSVSP